MTGNHDSYRRQRTGQLCCSRCFASGRTLQINDTDGDSRMLCEQCRAWHQRRAQQHEVSFPAWRKQRRETQDRDAS